MPKFGAFDFGEEKFGSATRTTINKPFNKEDILLIPNAWNLVVLSDSFFEDETAAKQSLIDSVVAAGGTLYPGIG
jgi:hypothetical protein